MSNPFGPGLHDREGSDMFNILLYYFFFWSFSWLRPTRNDCAGLSLQFGAKTGRQRAFYNSLLVFRSYMAEYTTTDKSKYYLSFLIVNNISFAIVLEFVEILPLTISAS